MGRTRLSIGLNSCRILVRSSGTELSEGIGEGIGELGALKCWPSRVVSSIVRRSVSVAQERKEQ